MALSKPASDETALRLALCRPRLEDNMDLIVLILSYLPVKSLGRFMVVCKSWNVVIRSKAFIELHLSRSEQNVLHLVSHFAVFMLAEDLPLSIKDVIASWNGLLCERSFDWDVDKLSICNPVTQQRFDIPEDYDCPYRRESLYGVGYGPWCYDYKVYKFPPSPTSEGQGGHECRMYSSITGSWKSIGPSPACPLYSRHVCVKGTVYWQIYKGRQDFTGSILAVDEHDSFHTFDLPELGSGWWPFLVSLGDSLGLVVIHKHIYFSHMSIWVLESPLPVWTKKLEKVIPLLNLELPLSAAVWGNLVLITTPRLYLAYYMDTDMWFKKESADSRDNDRFTHSGFFTESLVPCNGVIEP